MVNRAMQFARPPVAELLGIIPAVIFIDEDGLAYAAPAQLEGATREWCKRRQDQFLGELNVATGKTVIYE